MDDDFIQIKEDHKERVYTSYDLVSFLRKNGNSENRDIKFIDHLNNELVGFLEFLQPSNQEKILRKFMVTKIKDIIMDDLKAMDSIASKNKPIEENRSKKGSNDKQQDQVDTIHCFGSYETNLYLPGSDIDLTLFTKHEDALCKLQISLAKNPLIFSKSIIFLSKARVPILRFMDICHFRYDLSLNQDVSLKQSKFIKENIQKNPSIRYFVLFLKYFLKTRELNESKRGGLCSYAQILMILNFFSLHPMIQRGIKIKPNFAVLILDFFQLFGQDFSYSNAQICCNKYKKKDSNNFLSIEDPVDTSHDVGNLATNMSAIKEVFYHSYKIMSNASKEKLGDKYILLPLWVKIGDYELNWRENVLFFYEKLIVKNEL